MNLAPFTRALANAFSFGLSATRPHVPRSLTDVVRKLHSDNASSGTAALAFQSATNRFCIQNGLIPPPNEVATLNITLRQRGEPGLFEFYQELGDARQCLANLPTGPLKSAIAEELSLLLLKCYNAEVLWESRIEKAHRDKDPEIVAFSTLVLGEGHPTVAHVQAAVYEGFTPPLLTAKQTCEAVPSEAAEIWEQTEPLNGGMEAEAPPLPATPAPCRQVESSPSRHTYPQDPSIERLLRERESRSRPRLNFLKDMLGIPAA